MTALGLIVAIFIYPFLHEGGHVLATLISGGEVKEFMVFPLPNILSDVSGVSNAGLVFIGLSGVMLPFFLSVVCRPKYFFLWYSSFVFKGIVLLSILISSAIIIMNQFGFVQSNDDMIKVLNYWQNGTAFLLPILFVFGSLMVALMVKDHPIRRILKEFV
ncbi:MAG: hypothetical protein PHV32_00180 [Eubacteriales bacterium]|nr:hypothetical protein [Eubacteriales bacterium]HCG34937.1 hypothetical protein [Clostridiales bacterium]